MIFLDGEVRSDGRPVIAEVEFHEVLRADPRRPHRCPTCGRNATAYERTITRPQAAAMLAFARWHRNRPTIETHFSAADVLQDHSPEFARAVGGDYARLRFWNLLTPGRSGIWEVTVLGRQWVSSGALVPRRVLEFAGRVIHGPYGEPIGIEEALGTDFDARDLLCYAPPETVQRVLFDAAGVE